MPVQIAPADRKILLVAGGIFLLMIAAALVLVRGASSDQDIPSVYSTASGGCKAAFLLLQESGYQVKTWEQPLRDLPDGKGKTLVLIEPSTFPPNEEKEKLETFLKSGGNIVAAGQFAGFYLPANNTATDPLSSTTWSRVSALSPSPMTRAAPEITMASPAYWHLDGPTVGLYGQPNKPVVVEYTIGKGKVLWIAAPTPFTNAGVKETGNLEFFLTAIGGREQNQILWDEYIHGYQRSVASAKTHRIIAWIGLQLALLAAAVLLAYSRRSGPIWIPEGEVRLSPLEFVRTLGSLYEHANAGGVAVDISLQRFRYLLTRRLGLSANASGGDLARAVRDRGATPDDAFANTLSECESYRYDSSVPRKTALRLVQALFDYAVRLKLIRTHHGEKKAWKQS